MSLREQFGTDENKELNGVEVTYGKNDDGTIPTFVVSRMGKANKPYMKALELALRPYRRQIELKQIDNDTAGEVLETVFIKHVLKNWSNVKLADVTGSAKDEGDAPFNLANAKMLFGALPDLFDELNSQANDAANFRDAQLEADAKN